MFRKLLNSELGRPAVEEYKALSKSPITVILDNVRSRHNIGSAFRTGDAFRIRGIVLCGISSPLPPPRFTSPPWEPNFPWTGPTGRTP